MSELRREETLAVATMQRLRDGEVCVGGVSGLWIVCCTSVATAAAGHVVPSHGRKGR